MVGFGRARVQRLDERGDALRAVRTAERAGDDGSDIAVFTREVTFALRT